MKLMKILLYLVCISYFFFGDFAHAKNPYGLVKGHFRKSGYVKPFFRKLTKKFTHAK